MNSCVGCGVVLQNQSEKELGFVKNIDSNLCERCFRIRNYGDYKVVVKDNNEFINILKDIDKTGDLVVLVLDLFNFNSNLHLISDYLSNDVLLVLTKRDLIPKSVSDSKLLDYVNNYNISYIDSVVISSNKNYNFDLLFDKINKYKKSKNVYVVGFTNAGKSTMINKIIYNYSECMDTITTSVLPSTTLNKINIKINDDLNIIDTPGILSSGSIYDFVSGKELKKIIPKKEIKPISYQIKGKQYIMIDNFVKIVLNDINIVIFMSNSLNVKRFYKDFNFDHDNLFKIDVCNKDIVIDGLGFIKVVGSGNIDIYTIDGVSVYTRESMI